jgi:hypothetical protein
MNQGLNLGTKCLITALLYLIHFTPLNAQFVFKTDILPGFPTPVAYPAISPDGKHLVFLSDDGINKISITMGLFFFFMQISMGIMIFSGQGLKKDNIANQKILVHQLIHH